MDKCHMGDDKRERAGAKLLDLSGILIILGLLALVAAFLSPLRRAAFMLVAKALSLCGAIAFLGGWRLLLDSSDPSDELAWQWWMTTVVFFLLLALAYWAWVGEFW